MKKCISFLLITTIVFSSVVVSSAYSSSNAVNYSNTYADSPNYLNSLGSGYSYFGDHDCTNFVSQCLYAGGLSQDSTWYSYVEWHSNVPSRVNSNAWVNANALKNYLKDSGKATKIGSWSKNGTPQPYQTYAYVKNSNNLTTSNAGKVILFYDWEGEGTMNHSAFFVLNNATSTISYEGSGDLINQHSPLRKKVLWRPDLRQSNGNSTYLYSTRVYGFQLN